MMLLPMNMRSKLKKLLSCEFSANVDKKEEKKGSGQLGIYCYSHDKTSQV